MTETMRRIESLDQQRANLLSKIARLQGEVTRLGAERDALANNLGLPTEPGWYLTAEETPARLSEDGSWDDGYGNSGPEYMPAWHPLPLRRLEVSA